MIDSFQSLGVRLSKTLKEAKTLRNQLEKNFLMTQARINAHRLGVITLFMLFYVSPLFAMESAYTSLSEDSEKKTSVPLQMRPHPGDPSFGHSLTEDLRKTSTSSDPKEKKGSCWEQCCGSRKEPKNTKTQSKTS
jgi:hypothetical protein